MQYVGNQMVVTASDGEQVWACDFRSRLQPTHAEDLLSWCRRWEPAPVENLRWQVVVEVVHVDQRSRKFAVWEVQVGGRGVGAGEASGGAEARE